MPVVIASGKDLFLAYIVEHRTAARELGDSFAVVRFRGVWQHTFGDPDENGFIQHPLFSIGLHTNCFNEIRNSPLVQQLVSKSLIPQPGSEAIFLKLRHWIIGFHDETLEVIGASVEFLRVIEAESGIEAITRAANADGVASGRADG